MPDIEADPDTTKVTKARRRGGKRCNVFSLPSSRLTKYQWKVCSRVNLFVETADDRTEGLTVPIVSTALVELEFCGLSQRWVNRPHASGV